MFPGVPKLVQSKKLTFEAEIDDRSRPLGSEETLFATASGVVIVQTDDEVGQSETSFEESIHGGADGLTLRRRPADEDDDRFQTRQRWRKRVRSRDCVVGTMSTALSAMRIPKVTTDIPAQC